MGFSKVRFDEVDPRQSFKYNHMHFIKIPETKEIKLGRVLKCNARRLGTSMQGFKVRFEPHVIVEQENSKKGGWI